jgi:hypothetical protein
MPSNVDTLTQINLDDLVAAFGWQDRPRAARLLRRVFFGPARAFARHMADFNAAVGEHGLPEAARLTQRLYVRELSIFGRDRLPDGPFLALSNHPGMTDTLSVFVALGRRDLNIIVQQRPFLEALTNMAGNFSYIPDGAGSGIALFRRLSSHLRAGGAALTFPAGRIEPDPDLHAGALDSLRTWTDSVGMFVRLAPETAVVPVLVRGVVWKPAEHNPLLALKRSEREKERLAAALQLLAHVVFRVRDVRVRVQIGRPVTAAALGTTDTAAIHRAVLAEMQRLIHNPPEGQGERAL